MLLVPKLLILWSFDHFSIFIGSQLSDFIYFYFQLFQLRTLKLMIHFTYLLHDNLKFYNKNSYIKHKLFSSLPSKK